MEYVPLFSSLSYDRRDRDRSDTLSLQSGRSSRRTSDLGFSLNRRGSDSNILASLPGFIAGLGLGQSDANNIPATFVLPLIDHSVKAGERLVFTVMGECPGERRRRMYERNNR